MSIQPGANKNKIWFLNDSAHYKSPARIIALVAFEMEYEVK